MRIMDVGWKYLTRENANNKNTLAIKADVQNF